MSLRDRIVCAFFGHDEDFGLFERLGNITTCSNCHRVYIWDGKRWKKAWNDSDGALNRKIARWTIVIVVILVALFFLTRCASAPRPKVNCASVTYVTFAVAGQEGKCHSADLLLNYGGRSYSLACGSTIQIVYQGRDFILNGRALSIPREIACDDFGALKVAIRRSV